MKVLLVGSGGREHALAWKIAQSPLVERLYAAPGNPGIGRVATCIPIPVDAHDDLLRLAVSEGIDFAIVGPEAPLVGGLADRFAESGILALGPQLKAARLEGSKAFAKELMSRERIPTARFETLRDPDAARAYYQTYYQDRPVVVKADGLAAGKGAVICPTLEVAVETTARMMGGMFGDAGRIVVAEEFLQGEEVSFFALSNGVDVVSLGAAQDHKTIRDNDEGPNTGGMGAYSPVPAFERTLEQHVMDTIVKPTISALNNAGMPYRGVLFVGLMLTKDDGPKVLEFNCRFGDPECEVLMARLNEDIVPPLHAAARGDKLPERLAWKPEAAVCVVLASGGYPGPYRTGVPIEGVAAAEEIDGVRVFHAGTAESDGRLVTAGGRVLSVTATAPSIGAAIDRAYAAVDRIRFDGMHSRRDIGRRAIVGS
ncbi:MAG TPA: phosphoribosylamine--glycine ligase [Methylomirabilota bacterium]|nr:phosphoribosylamine--glycine ligase [Methylomirabilota bacterium]